MHSALELILVLLASAVLAVTAFRWVHLPPLLGYLVVGIAIGPHSLALIPDSEQMRRLAEFGIVFLMFSIGLEFNLPTLFSMRRAVFGLGLVQVLLTIGAVVAGGVLAGFQWHAALAVGGALAMSSTAIVMRMLAERMQLDTAHGRDIVGVLLFQDLAVVPLLIVIPAIADGGGDLAQRLMLALAKAGIVLGIALFLGHRLMRPWLHLVASRRSHELFILNVLLVTLGMAWLTEVAGLSLALGAFLAGMLIAETPYRHQVDEDIKPFREVLLGLFFVTMGMKLDIRVVANEASLVIVLALLPVVFKLALIAGLARLFGAGAGTALRIGLALAHAGEFGLVLIVQANDVGLLDPGFTQVVVAAMLLSMLASPFILQASDRIVLRWARSEWMLKSLELHRIAVQSLATEKHVIVCGYGRTGQRLAHLLEEEHVRYIALDLDPDRVRQAGAAGDTVVYGDASNREALVAAGLARASALVVTFVDTARALKILHHAHQINPALPVLVRTLDDADLDRLLAAGAAEVVPETFESSLMLGSHALMLVGVPLTRVVRRIRDVRAHRYNVLRGFYRGESDESSDPDESRAPRLRSIALVPGAHAVGRRLGELALDALGVKVTAMRRREARAPFPGPQTELLVGDVLVLLGAPEQLAAAEARLLGR
jgi:monovalent cation:H+ antiporter-2, CPA2 family